LGEGNRAEPKYTPKAVPQNKQMTDRWNTQVKKALNLLPVDGILKIEEIIL
jgi:hypothetical protein